ncbi:hypothetical protein AAZX31_06G062700 [Glycine max]|uniref:Uncharacterized protein n=2 Tax=Glycine subgen. Soja TaxID=1462606 RepID=I1K8R7_SOYBN|nr:uncharacterized protein LOC102660700 [Glycine max]XP_028234181.1 uncharacterized protein LOC114413999 [Glycine soja]KAG5018601.1 hypothetical protein JHK87_014456 [Glycine soja]KAG5045160.1 hypothetical protein JHK86_014566 [Glycine max]KAG5147663.1 hypothetical protein JHK82_014544 [Glycine max]KAH1124469.1 hypothetical protein GYH30_014270 [Glycine max]KAH1244740.1 hypothetical protein GmHk_06G015283 [Glycine max]|eukprot:XP_006581341.1 uncharacterized protein LOC102660700 [Glycine max]
MAGTPSRLEEIIASLNCFRVLYAPQGPHRYESRGEEQETLEIRRKWLRKKLERAMKVLSEILVWPKKSFSLRRLRTCISEAKEMKRKMQFQYDPKSYALNFDDGSIEEDDGVFLDFSARYACPLGINKLYLEWEHSEA